MSFSFPRNETFSSGKEFQISISDLVVINFLEMKIKGFKINFFPRFFLEMKFILKSLIFISKKLIATKSEIEI